MSDAVKAESAQGASNKKERIVQIISEVIDKVGHNEQASLKTVLTELRELLIVIKEMRHEISQTSPADIKGRAIPGATDELDAIVDATSEATGTIMDSCDVIQEKASNVGGEDGDAIANEVMKIFEACSFQDITGQRVTKVITTFREIEEKMDRISAVLGIDLDNAEEFVDKREGDEKLLNGPQLSQDALVQDDIDKLLAEFDD